MKRCSFCKEERPLEEFHQNRKRPDGRQTVCRDCKKAYNRRYYVENAQRHRKMRARHKKALLSRVNELIRQAKAVPCADCGRRYPSDAMDFDHVRGTKLVDAAGMRRLGLRGVKAEIAKCDVVCVNCHRLRTKRRRARGRALLDRGWIYDPSGGRTEWARSGSNRRAFG